MAVVLNTYTSTWHCATKIYIYIEGGATWEACSDEKYVNTGWVKSLWKRFQPVNRRMWITLKFNKFICIIVSASLKTGHDSTSFYVRSLNCEKWQLSSPCLAICPHGTTQLPLGEFSWNLIFEYFFSKICREDSNLIKIWQNNGYFTRTQYIYSYIFDHTSPSSSYNEKCFRQKL